MKTTIHKAESRGHANHGWLNSYHTFSFSGYYNPERINFGVLRVLNDDTVAPGMGFGKHPHDNMEIISIPLEGALLHKDSMGNEQVIRKGDVQVMSAGTGIFHSEHNYSNKEAVKFLQIWVIPNKRNVSPRYDQITLNEEDTSNQFYQVLSPNANDSGVWIHQDAWFHLGRFDKEMTLIYALKKQNNGIYVFMIEGNAIVGGQQISRRSGMTIIETDQLEFKISEKAEILIMEVPLQINQQ